MWEIADFPNDGHFNGACFVLPKLKFTFIIFHKTFDITWSSYRSIGFKKGNRVIMAKKKDKRVRQFLKKMLLKNEWI